MLFIVFIFNFHSKISEDENVIIEPSNVKDCIEDTVITIVDSDSDNNQKNVVRNKNYVFYNNYFNFFMSFKKKNKK